MSPQDIINSGALWLAIPVAMLAGLISFLSPCVLPLVPGYLGFLGSSVSSRSTGSAATPARRQLVLGVLLFILGFSVVFVGITALSGTVGVFLLRWGDLITRILGAVIILMGLVFLGFFGFAQRELRFHVDAKTGIIGAPLLGVALGIGWAPCIGPTLAVILTMAFDSGSAARAALLGVAYSLGLGIPFLLLTLGFGWATRSVSFVRRHIRVVNLIGGAVLIVLGLLMVTGVWTAVMAQLQGVFASVPAPL